tara:strand:+ start:1740 stop:2219 length:480 start_codon:yes stop_codon:yes gene_type:complete
MVVVENNNGDALVCLIILIDSIALENNSAVVVETHHQEDCTLVDYMKERELSNESLGKLDPTSREAMEHLYACDCDADIEATFCRPDGEMLFVPFLLSEIKREHPWLNDDVITKKMLITARELGPRSPLVKKMKPLFQKHLGRHYMSGLSPHGFPETIH